MKKLISLFLIIPCLFSFAQEVEKTKTFSTFQFGALAGINFSTLTGSSFVIEGKTNLISGFNAKFSFEYSTINKEEGYHVKTYKYQEFFDNYTTESYDVDEINYDVFPISLGLEYVFLANNFSPYGLFEVGYNYYTFHTQTSNRRINSGGTYETYDELPSEYKNNPPVISENESYRIALGVGTNYKLSSAINLDVRYLYQVNKSLINTNQILVGINF